MQASLRRTSLCAGLLEKNFITNMYAKNFITNMYACAGLLEKNFITLIRAVAQIGSGLQVVCEGFLS